MTRIRFRTRLACAAVTAIALLLIGFGQAAADSAPKNDVKRAEYYLEKMETKAKRMRGQSFNPGYEGKEALKRIKALKEKYPDDPAVEALYERARAVLMTSKGDAVEITPDMLEYREAEDKLEKLFAKEAKKQWDAYLKEIRKREGTIEKAFPAPSHRDNSVDSMKGRTVILEDFEFPTNEFTDMGAQYVHVGKGAKGYYFVELSGRDWLAPYEAVKRYRRLINHDLPEGGKWTVVGRIQDIRLLVPEAGKKKVRSAQWGWSVVPEAIWVPDVTFARVDKDLEDGAQFAGEDRMEEIKGPMYSIKSVPDDVTPERLIEIFVTAIKEKNYDLYRECIDPARTQTAVSRDRVMYHWEWHQKRFAEFYVHIVTEKAQIKVLKGEGSSGVDEDFFLSDDQKKKASKIADDLVEEAVVVTRAYNEKGKQYGSPKPHHMRRVGGDKSRWYIIDYPQPF